MGCVPVPIHNIMTPTPLHARQVSHLIDGSGGAFASHDSIDELIQSNLTANNNVRLHLSVLCWSGRLWQLHAG